MVYAYLTADMEIFYEVTHSIAQFVQMNRVLILWTTSILAALAALVILLVRSQVLPEQRWAKFFGWAFAVFAIQYALYICRHHLRFSNFVVDGMVTENLIDVLLLSLAANCSILNNLLFLAAARDLRDKELVIPKWAWGLAALSLVSIIGAGVWWSRLPDAMFSAYCLGAVSYAISVNMSVRPRFFAVGALMAGFLYAFFQFSYGLNPLLAQMDSANIVEYEDKLLFLDSLETAIVLPLKFLFFLWGLMLLLRSLVILSSSDVERISRQIVNGRLEYLTTEGIVKSIGESVRADAVELFVKLPGIQNNLIAMFDWRDNVPSQPEPQIAPLPSSVENIERWIFLERTEVFTPAKSGQEYFVHRARDGTIKHIVSIEDRLLIVGVPVHYHGAVIGCLKIKWEIVGLVGMERLQRKMNLSASLRATMASHVKQLADMIAPGVQSFRELAALNSLSSKFARLQVRQSVRDVEESVRTITEFLHDILSPLATVIQIEMGFRAFSIVKVEHSPIQKSLEEIIANHKGEQISDALPEYLDKSGIGQLAFMISPLFLRARQDESDYLIGKLMLAVPSDKDETGRPTLATNPRYRRAVASLISNAVLDSAREYLGSILKDLGVHLNGKNTLNIPEWFQWVEKTAKDAGLLWAVAKQPVVSPLLGEPEAVSIIENLRRTKQPNGDMPYCCRPINPPIKDLHSVIEIRLPNTGAQVWLGVARAGFGIELEFPSPWKIFIEHFAETADAALIRLTAAVEMESLQVKAAHYQGLATVAVTTGTLIHQIVNLVKDLTGAGSELLEAYHVGDLKCDESDGKLLKAMSESAHRLLKLTSNITNITKLDERRPCTLFDAVRESTKLFELSLAQHGISLENKVSPEIVIDIPFYIAALAIANLISNAKDAIGNSGKGSVIVIKAENSEDMVYCYITDDGPGIPDAIKDHIFEIGATTKPNSGGWGLYLVARSLRENRGSIELSHTGPGGTEFTIRFPKERGEGYAN